MQSCGFWVNMVDICPETAAKLMAISNTLGTIPGVIGQPLTQAILDASGSWSTVFGVGGVVAIVAGLIFAALGDDKPIDRRPESYAPTGKSEGPEVVGKASFAEEQ
mmetsp:Transcript_16082/g.23962  ORF Transcript_16082/g.23962 Transcript_16082/m.23962 type:complete len:106 (-) Transcript_16082:266-583(-)